MKTCLWEFLTRQPRHKSACSDGEVNFRYDIMLECSCNVHPTPHFYIVKLGFTGVYIIFLYLLKNIDCGYSLEPPQ